MNFGEETFATLREDFNMRNPIIVTDKDVKYYLYKPTMCKRPKSWRQVGVRRFKEFKETHYTTWLFTLYLNRDNKLRYGVYLDGCMSEQFGVLSEIKELI